MASSPLNIYARLVRYGRLDGGFVQIFGFELGGNMHALKECMKTSDRRLTDTDFAYIEGLGPLESDSSDAITRGMATLVPLCTATRLSTLIGEPGDYYFLMLVSAPPPAPAPAAGASGSESCALPQHLAPAHACAIVALASQHGRLLQLRKRCAARCALTLPASRCQLPCPLPSLSRCSVFQREPAWQVRLVLARSRSMCTR
jgi:hypothetical protein